MEVKLQVCYHYYNTIYLFNNGKLMYQLGDITGMC